MKLNLGSGDSPLPDTGGWVNLDAKFDDSLFPLRMGNVKPDGSVPDQSVETVRASHCLEHFKLADIPAVLAEWVRVLKPGGWLKVAVPDFSFIAKTYLGQIECQTSDGSPVPLASWVLGDQADEYAYHKAIFDEASLRKFLTDAGLVNVQRWESEIQDCAALPVSLNLMGQKPEAGAQQKAYNTIACRHGNKWYSTLGIDGYCCICCGIRLVSPGYCVGCSLGEVKAESWHNITAWNDGAPEHLKKPEVAEQCPHGNYRNARPSHLPVSGVRCACCYQDAGTPINGTLCSKCDGDGAIGSPLFGRGEFCKNEKLVERWQVFAAGRWQDLFDGAQIDAANEQEAADYKANKLPIRRLESTKQQIRIAAVMSLPRVGFLDSYESICQALATAGIPRHLGWGVYWHHSLSRGIVAALEATDPEGYEYDYILTADYDSFVLPEDVTALATILAQHPEVDAVVPMQIKRGGSLEVLAGWSGGRDLTREFIPIDTGHFGFTLFRRSFFDQMPPVWFKESADETGHWGANRTDADIAFWRAAKAVGLNTALATRIVLGHGEEVISYPRIVNGKIEKVYQSAIDWQASPVRPEGIGVIT